MSTKYIFTGTSRKVGRFGTLTAGDIVQLEDNEVADVANSAEFEQYAAPAEVGNALQCNGVAGVVVVADDANLDFGVADFSLSIDVAMADWTPAAEEILIAKHASNLGYKLGIATDGTLILRLGNGTNFTTLTYSSTKSVGALANTRHRIDVTVDRSGNATFYVDGEILGDAVDISAAVAQTVSNTGSFQVMSDGSSFSEGQVSEVTVWNRALSVVEVFKAHRYIDSADRWASNTEIASGTLTVGKRYRITAIDDEDFTDDGASANTVGVEFVADAATITLDAGDKVIAIGAVLHWVPENIQPAGTQWLDLSTNSLHGLQSVAGAEPTRPPNRFKLSYTLAASGFLAGSERAVLPAEYSNLNITAKTSNATGPTVTIGQDATTDNDRVTTQALNGTGTNGGLMALTVAQVLTEREVYVAMDANASSTEFILTGDVL